MTLSLFDLEPAPAPVVTAHVRGFETMKPETQEAICTMVQAAYDAATRGDLPGHVKAADSFALGKLEDFNPHALAFVAQARKHGATDPSLTPVSVSAAGRREFDVLELSRYANELLRDVRSDRPAMTPERWGEAIAKVREIGGKS